MKVAVVTNSLAIGGVRRIAIEQVHWLSKLGHETYAVPLSQRGMWFDLIKKRNISVKFPSKFSGGLKKFLNLPIDLLLQKWVREGYFYSLGDTYFAPLVSPIKPIDVTICHNTFPIQYGFLTKLFTGVPFIAHIHDTATFVRERVKSTSKVGKLAGKLLTNVEKTIVKNASAVIADSKKGARDVEHGYHLKCGVVYPGCYAPEEIPQRRGDYILAFGRWARERDPIRLLDLYRELHCDNRLVIAGSWNPTSEFYTFMRLVKKRGLRDKIEVLNSVSEAKLEELYFKARVYVHLQPENLNMPAFEAAAHGCPIVVPRDSGVCELFEDEISQYSVNSDDVSAFIDRVSKLVSNDELAWRIGYEGWKRAKEYTWLRHVQALEGLMVNFS